MRKKDLDSDEKRFFDECVYRIMTHSGLRKRLIGQHLLVTPSEWFNHFKNETNGIDEIVNRFMIADYVKNHDY